MLRVAIVGYGNLGRGVEKELLRRKDAQIVGIFTRREAKTLETQGSKAYHINDLENFIGKIDVCVLCGGSAYDLPQQTPSIAKHFNVVDSYDNHALIQSHQKAVNQSAKKTTAIVSVGWDPGLFSLQRIYIETILGVESQTFWGEGISQGHSDALRGIEGVIDAIQITQPRKEAMTKVRQGEHDILDKHKRLAYVVTNRKDLDVLDDEIKNMPNYFKGYETEVTFLSQEELDARFPNMPHGGFVIGSDGASQMEFSLKLDSNPNFTAQVLVAYAYACFNMNQANIKGAYTIFDVAPRHLASGRYDIL